MEKTPPRTAYTHFQMSRHFAVLDSVFASKLHKTHAVTILLCYSRVQYTGYFIISENHFQDRIVCEMLGRSACEQGCQRINEYKHVEPAIKYSITMRFANCVCTTAISSTCSKHEWQISRRQKVAAIRES